MQENQLSPSVQMQLLRPRQLEAALRAFPVVYVPIGLIEWHGQHLPLGTDALKAHGILVKCAEQFGGVVYPPLYFPHALYDAGSRVLRADEPDWKVGMMTALFERIKLMGARVIIGVSGHNIPQQLALMTAALDVVTADGSVAGAALYEMSLSLGDESASDHAAKWETSNMMFFHPEQVDLSQLGDGPLAPDMAPPDGIGGLDPRVHALYEVGRRNVELTSASIGQKAQELLASLPEGQRELNLPGIVPPHWWMI